MRDEALDTAEGFGEGKALERVDESLDSFDSPVHLEAHHCSEAVLLARRDAVSRMRLQARIVDTLHHSVVAQKVDHAGGVLAVNAHPRVESANTAQSEEAVERSARNPQTVRPPRQLLDQGGVGRHHRSAHHVTMSVQILRRGVNDEIRTELDWSLQR